MRTLSFLFNGALLGMIAAFSMPAQGLAQKPRVAVLSMENRTSWWQEQLGLAAADQLTTHLVNDGGFAVIERERLQAVIDEQGFQMTGAVEPSQVAQLGLMAGAEYLITGSVTRFGIDRKGASIGGIGASYTEAESAVNIRVINTETAEIVWAGEGEGKKRIVGMSSEDVDVYAGEGFNPGLAGEALSPAMEQLMGSLSSLTLSSSTPPAEIVGEGQEGAVYIGQGQNVGVQVGDRYVVLRVVDEILNAQGKVLDRLTEKVGVVEVTRVLTQSAVATVVAGEAKPGDTLEPQGGE
jgi:curli biogenesis system outer membrane secretion channel CsgG